MIRVLTSGGFDPLHPAQLEYLQKSKGLDAEVCLIVVLHSDEWLLRRKGFMMMNYAERAAILEGLSCVDLVVPALDAKNTIVENLELLKPDVYSTGAPMILGNVSPEIEACVQLGIKVQYNVGSPMASSSTIFRGALPPVERPWGEYRIIYSDGRVQIKILDLKPGKSTSLQTHEKRNELFLDVEELLRKDGIGTPFTWIRAGSKHQLHGKIPKGSKIIEVQYGEDVDESDIRRY